MFNWIKFGYVSRWAAVAVVLSPLAWPQSSDLATIVAKMSEVQHRAQDQHQAYELLRRYQVFDKDDQKLKTDLLARIEFAPPEQKSYTIEKSSGGIGERAIRHALDHEMDLTRSPERVEMTERNYSFTLAGEETLKGERCFVLEAHPKRNDHDLLKARIWVDSDDFHIRKIQGHPQKSPSFWVKDIELTLEYSEMSGMWMHTTTRADADIRFSGPFTLISRDLSVHLAPAELAKSAVPRARPLRAAALAGAALHSVR
ncbi:MAG: hypothetical protein NVS9B15_16720 [Acidobacteriaceae bacterium]